MTTSLDNKRVLRLRAFFTLCKLGLAICCVASTQCAIVGGQESQNARKSRQVVYFTTQVESASAPVYASPNFKSYRAGTVLKDRDVEIYFRNDDGFCAIRPPYGSFSWINGKFVVQDDAGDGVVRISSGKTAPVRVGGESPATSSVVQVGLRNNQKVKILGKVTLSDGSLWYKISPPAGEFRWLHESSLPKNASLALVPNKLTFQDEYERRNSSLTTADYRGTSAPNQSSAQSPAQLPGDDAANAAPTLPDAATSKPETVKPIPRDDGDERGLELPPYQIGIDVNGLKNADESLRRELAEINAETLKLAVNRDPSREEIKALRRRAESVALTAKNLDEQQMANAILDALRGAEENAVRLENLRAEKYPMVESVADPTPPSPVNLNAANALANRWITNAPPYPTTPQTRPPVYPQTAPGFPVLASPQPQPAFVANVAPQSAPVPRSGRVVNGMFIPEPVVVAAAPQTTLAANQPEIRTDARPVIRPRAAVSKEAIKAAEPKNKSKLEFAFSNANNPFGRRSASQTTNAPELDLPAAKLIVPPQSYGQGAFLAQRKGATNDSPAWLAQKSDVQSPSPEQNVVAQAQPTQGESRPQSKSRAEGAVVFQAPFEGNASEGALVAASEPIANSEVTVWQSAAEARVSPVAPTPAAKLAGATTNLPRAIRQTSAFAPVAANSAAHFDAEGLLVELSDAPQGAPKFALLKQNADGYAIVAYLETKKEGVFAPFIGKKVAVKGAVGSVSVDGDSHKLISVTSLFLQK